MTIYCFLDYATYELLWSLRNVVARCGTHQYVPALGESSRNKDAKPTCTKKTNKKKKGKGRAITLLLKQFPTKRIIVPLLGETMHISKKVVKKLTLSCWWCRMSAQDLGLLPETCLTSVEPGVLLNTYNPSTWEAKIREDPRLEASLSYMVEQLVEMALRWKYDGRSCAAGWSRSVPIWDRKREGFKVRWGRL